MTKKRMHKARYHALRAENRAAHEICLVFQKDTIMWQFSKPKWPNRARRKTLVKLWERGRKND